MVIDVPQTPTAIAEPALLPTAWLGLRAWEPRRWWTAGGLAFLAFWAIALPTALVPNPIFGRSIEPTWWSYPVTLVTAILAGMVLASYLNLGAKTEPAASAASDHRLSAGGLLAFFAVGCPVCNKAVLIALGSTGALQWFAPIQPFMALAGIGLLSWALLTRLRGSVRCSISD